jgi:HSP20 family molecular chaperone IbpA
MSLFPRFGGEFRPFFRLLEDYDRVSRELASDTFSNVASFSPKCDVKEDNDAYTIHCEVPGIPQDRINIEWSDGNTLTISGSTEQRSESGTRPQGFVEGEKKDKEHQPTVEDEPESSTKEESTAVATKGQQEVAKASAESKYWVTERSYGSFTRSFSFPVRVDQDAVKAKLTNGVLEITVPKSRRTNQKKTIAIE